MRKVIFHFHLFKNAGTSLDAILKGNFPGQWVTREFASQPILNRTAVHKWIEETPEAVCFSSHTAILPPPVIEHTKVLPVIFYRHPIDRIVSAYTFERQQQTDGFGAILARNTTLAGYIEVRLALSNDRQCRNFHVSRLAQMVGAEHGDEFSRAKKAIASLAFIGVVEKFAQSLEQLQRWLVKEGFKNLDFKPVERNVLRASDKPREAKMAEVREELGEVIYQKLIEANREDLELYDFIVSRC